MNRMFVSTYFLAWHWTKKQNFALLTLCKGTVDQWIQLMNHQCSWWRHQTKHFPRYWPFVRRIHRSPVNSPHKGQWRGALIFPFICAWINGDLRRHRAHYDFTVMAESAYMSWRHHGLCPHCRCHLSPSGMKIMWEWSTWRPEKSCDSHLGESAKG